MVYIYCLRGYLNQCKTTESVHSLMRNSQEEQLSKQMAPHKKWSFPLSISKLQIWLHLLKKSLMENFIFVHCRGLGPSGMDADGWRRILALNSFITTNSNLRKAFANVVKQLCADLIETKTVEALLQVNSSR